MQLLTEAGIECSYLFSSLDSAARKINIAMFRNRKVNTLLVTDLAARGIDIPLLDNVINFHFPGKPKLFVHRVGTFNIFIITFLLQSVSVSVPRIVL